MTSHDVTGHGGVRAARVMGLLCLFVSWKRHRQLDVAYSNLNTDLHFTASSGPLTAPLGKVWRVIVVALVSWLCLFAGCGPTPTTEPCPAIPPE